MCAASCRSAAGCRRCFCAGNGGAQPLLNDKQRSDWAEPKTPQLLCGPVRDGDDFLSGLRHSILVRRELLVRSWSNTMLDGRAHEPTTADGAMRRGGHYLRAVDAAARGCVFRAQRSQSLWRRPLPKTLLRGVRPLFESNARNRCALLAATFSVLRLRTQSRITSSSIAAVPAPAPGTVGCGH